MNLRRFFGVREPVEPAPNPDELSALRARCAELEARLRESEASLRERGKMLYDLQKQYSSEHFDLHESMRNLKIERMRNAGAFAGQEVILERARSLQARIAELKARLRAHEAVEDLHEDIAPIVAEDQT